MDQRWKRAALVGAGVLVLVVATVVTWGVLQEKKADWFSAWASGASAIVATFALLAAGVAANATIATNRNQSEQLRRLEETNQRELASKFGVWIEDRYPNFGYVHSWRHQIHYHNAGPLPMFAVEVLIHFGNQTLKITRNTLAPTKEVTEIQSASNSMRDFVTEIAAERLKELRPQETEPDEISSEWQDWSEKVEHLRTTLLKWTELSLSVEFSDGEYRWRREANGSLSRIS
ncbi:hypothetical protein P3102_35270 [Amycolatopsis sp. QT-25]|uniref:hypothetical protein n=1 Tax=Amycolatopsis sp. QT-25 TaxID=3034022 RepID=UPI0023EDD559|nr:hypothetical protein [Amycolatopsis sp. QT-25]WET79231.1 hypothetical protein P3102_35270 [Amycolatopsis sp. QT-25]